MVGEPNYFRMLTPITRKPQQWNIAGFDIETFEKAGRHEFYMGSCYSGEFVNVFYDAAEMRDFMLSCRGYKFFAHNLDFDMDIFTEDIMSGCMKVVKTSRLIYARYPNKLEHGDDSVYFYDSMNYFPTSLDRLGRVIGVEKMAHPECLGRKPRTEAERKYLEEYNIQDSRITYEFAVRMQKFLAEYGSALKPTIAGCSLDIFRRRYLRDSYPQLKRWHSMKVHDAYAGGRTEAFKRGLVKGLNYYDVNSMYPSVMERYEYPLSVGACMSSDPNDYKRHEGVTDAVIRSPRVYMPYLHLRGDKLLFPTGKFRGQYTNFELREAKRLGYDVRPVRSLLFPKTSPVFADFVRDMFGKRKDAKERGSYEEQFYKLVLNSLYGKFGQKARGKVSVMKSSDITTSYLSRMMAMGFTFKESGDGRLTFMTDNIGIKEAPYTMPMWSCYVTSYARHELYSHFSDCGFDNVFYTDTDSLFTSRKLPTSSDLGKLKLEGEIRSAIIVKPKMYAIDVGGKGIVKAKGCRISTREQFDEMLEYKRSKFTAFTKLGTSMRYGKPHNGVVDSVKTIDLEDNKRLWLNLFNPREMEDSLPLDI